MLWFQYDFNIPTCLFIPYNKEDRTMTSVEMLAGLYFWWLTLSHWILGLFFAVSGLVIKDTSAQGETRQFLTSFLILFPHKIILSSEHALLWLSKEKKKTVFFLIVMGKLDDLVLQIIKMPWTFVCLDVNKVKQTLQIIDLRTKDFTLLHGLIWIKKQWVYLSLCKF